MSLLILPELILGSLGILLLLFLALGPGKVPVGVFSTITILGLLGAGLSAFFLMDFGSEKLLQGMLQPEASFLFIRLGLPIVAAVLVLMAMETQEIAEARKPELSFFVVWMTFLALLLVTSKNLMVTYVSLASLGLIGSLLTAMPIRREEEGVAALSSWRQLSVALLAGFGCLLVLSVVADDLGYDSLRKFFQADTEFRWILVLPFFMAPFLVVGGLFPFHSVSMTLGYRAIWVVQAILTLLIQGPVTVALLKIILGIFGGATSPYGASVLAFLTAIGFLGAFCGGIGALTQWNSKRWVAFLALLQWSTILIVGSSPTALGLSAGLFHSFSVGMALTIIFVMLGTFHEGREGDQMESLRSYGGWKVAESLVLLAALASLAGIPPFMGFPAVFNMTNAVLGQGQSAVFLGYVFLLAIQFVLIARVVGLLFFDRTKVAESQSQISRLSLRTKILFASLTAPLFLFGLFWESIWQSLVDRSGNFIIF